MIATRNLDVLEEELAHVQSRKVLGPKERAGETWDKAADWVGDRVSRVIPSRREEQLVPETREFAERMTRGLVALQASLCFEALLEPEATSPSAAQAFSMAVRFTAAREKFQAQFREKKEASLTDFRYFKANEKRERLEQELEALLGPVETHWGTLKELEGHWLLRSRGVPEVLYVSVNEAGLALEVFLPEQ